MDLIGLVALLLSSNKSFSVYFDSPNPRFLQLKCFLSKGKSGLLEIFLNISSEMKVYLSDNWVLCSLLKDETNFESSIKWMRSNVQGQKVHIILLVI